MQQSNNFWIILSDVGPIMLFSSMIPIFSSDNTNALSTQLMFFGAIFCRICSLTYHIFSDTIPCLYYLDLIGIASNAFAVPWISIIVFSEIDTIYCMTMMFLYLVCVIRFTGRALTILHVKKEITTTEEERLHQHLLMTLAVAGNLPTLYGIVMTPIKDNVRLLLFMGIFFLASGYTLFYVLKLPDSLLESYVVNGVHGKWWHSHVLWHIFSAVGQLSFLITVYEK